ncbi:hypothetical protein HERIO_766 [Hepatospora eriocheir]|uniref:Uncharacterized protein n=1 Tax=Hepatospora eriocheir TaxID=1081669 RepID=A0A1X0QCC5_9MICR|nr:hypothetical protein HERIO_766 [Hepatospora eriocheir]
MINKGNLNFEKISVLERVKYFEKIKEENLSTDVNDLNTVKEKFIRLNTKNNNRISEELKNEENVIKIYNLEKDIIKDINEEEINKNINKEINKEEINKNINKEINENFNKEEMINKEEINDLKSNYKKLVKKIEKVIEEHNQVKNDLNEIKSQYKILKESFIETNNQERSKKVTFDKTVTELIVPSNQLENENLNE